MSHTSTASALADFTDQAHTAAVAHARCRATGLDPATYRGLAGVALTLGHTSMLIKAPRWDKDRDLINALISLATDLAGRCAVLRATQTNVAHSKAQAIQQAHAEHANGGVSDDTRLWLADCLRAQDILQRAITASQYAGARLAAVPAELGERYEAVYRLVNQGRVMPFNGRWLTGTGS